MDSTIGYLLEVREDLLDAAWRAERGVRRPGKRRIEWTGKKTLAAALATCLLAAGVTGWVVTRPDRNQAFRTAGAVKRAAFGDTTAHEGVVAGGPPARRGVTIPQSVVSSQIAGLPDLSKVIKTASVSVVVPTGSFGRWFADASQVASAYGGYVETSSTGDEFGRITMRVPADRFDDALSQLRGLGHVESQTIRGKDVTSDYIDLQARLRIAQARRVVLLRLMQKAHSIRQTIQVQNALDDTQREIEDLQGSLNVLDNRVSFATIQLGMREQGVQVQSHVTNPSIPNSWDRAIAGFIGVIGGLIVGLGYVIPIAILVALAWLVVVRVRRRRVA